MCFLQQHLKQITVNCFSKGFDTQEQHLYELYAVLPCKTPVGVSTLLHTNHSFFFYTTLPQLLQEITYLYRKKYFWDVTKVQLKAFSKYHYNLISVFVIINLELYGLMCLP